MAIDKKFIHCSTKDAFIAQLIEGNIPDTAIVFIQDSRLIYTHGTFYNGSDLGDVALTYIPIISKNEYYDDNGVIITTSSNRYRTCKFSTLGKFIAKFSWTANNPVTLKAHTWNSKGEYAGNVSVQVDAGTSYEWSLVPSEGDAYYAFDFNTDDVDSSTIFVNIEYRYAQDSEVIKSINSKSGNDITIYGSDITLNTKIASSETPVFVDQLVEGSNIETVVIKSLIDNDKYIKNKIPTKISQLDNDSSYLDSTQVTNQINTSISNKANKITVQDISSQIVSQSGSYTFQPNIYYVISATGLAGKILNVTLGTPSDNSILNEYMIQFTTPSGGCTLTIPSSIKWMDGESPIIEGGKTYQLSIINNLAVFGVFE